ncbi:GPW/gp25 family protein [Aeoliella mucimassa]|uniref:Gene 25-like lysozyme n=1 Tax=Aeoliella mucimassa TaxID=2527972 RepID=A0A518AUF5_9BACT|nr:GPW/gp25 family protein [Aeoliella mucimassa]QDU58358.1 Gene 25-like lysozyme [Aeoliella mucimassa]
MLATKSHPDLVPSLLDKLTLASYDVSSSVPADPVRGLLRDITDLLNTWTTADARTEGFDELASSITCYGAPLPSSLVIGTYDNQQAVGRRLEQLIVRFEPRIATAKVTVTPNRQQPTTCQLTIVATLTSNPDTTISADYSVNYRQGRAQVELVQS